MKVQWQLVDVETKKVIPVGCEFELVDFMKKYFDKGNYMEWVEALIICGDPWSIKNPVGILGSSPVHVYGNGYQPRRGSSDAKPPTEE